MVDRLKQGPSLPASILRRESQVAAGKGKKTPRNLTAFPKFTLGLARCSSNVGAAGSRGFVKEANQRSRGAFWGF